MNAGSAMHRYSNLIVRYVVERHLKGIVTRNGASVALCLYGGE